MLKNETQSLQSLKDLFLFITACYKRDLAAMAELNIAEITEFLYSKLSEPMINAHHQQLTVWNNLINLVGQWFPSG
jgi:hypothetical protein